MKECGILNNNKIMLAYGFKPEEKLLLDGFVEEKKIPGYKVVSDEMSEMKIGDIFEGYKFDVYSGTLPDEKVVIFNNFNDSEIDIAIKCLKEISKGIIMAVATPTSINWTFDYLIHHLIEERQWYKSNKV